MTLSNSSTGTAQIGVTGLAVMGSNIARNFANHGYTVALHNRSIAKTDALLAEHASEGNFVRSETIAAPYFRSAIEGSVDSWRRVVVTATELGIPIPGFSSSLSYYDALRTERLPAALTQGLRDFFGAHTYGRIDADPAKRFHTLWSGDHTEVLA